MDGMVVREGTKRKLLGEDFGIGGGNIYWVGLDENVMYANSFIIFKNNSLTRELKTRPFIPK